MKKLVTILLSSVFAASLAGAIAFYGAGHANGATAVAETAAVEQTLSVAEPALATASNFGITENPNSKETTEQYIWDAFQIGKLYSFNPVYIASKQTTWTDTKTNAFVAIYLNSSVNFATSNVKWSNNARYIYYGTSHDTADEDLQVSRGESNPSGGYALANKGGAGWVAYVTNVKNANGNNFNPAKLVFKKGFAIAMNDDSVYALASDYVLYNVNGAYIPAKTTDQFLADMQAKGLTVTTQEVTVNGASYNSSSKELYLSTDSNMSAARAEVCGHYSVNSEDITVNGNNLSTWCGYVMDSDTKKLQYNNVAAFSEGDELVVKEGFTSLWGVDSTTIYAVKNKTEFKVSWFNGGFVNPGSREYYVYKAKNENKYYEVTPKAITGVQKDLSGGNLNNLKTGTVAIFIDTDKSFAKANVAYYNNAGYICYGTSYDDENLKPSTKNATEASSGYIMDEGGVGGVGNAFYVLNVKESGTAITPAKVVLKAGFMLALKDDTVFALKDDYTLYRVNGMYLPATSVEGLKEAYSDTQVDDVTVKYVTYNNGAITFGTDKQQLLGSAGNPCVSFGDLTLNDSALSTWSGYVISENGAGTDRFVLKSSLSLSENDVLKLSNFSTVFYSATESKFYVIRVSDETAFRYTSSGFVGRHTVTIKNGDGETTEKVFPGDGYTLGTQSNNGKIFIGWKVKYTQDGETKEELKAANSEITVNADLTIEPQWIDYALQEGAYIRLQTTADTSGIRFVANLNKNSFDASSAYIKKIGVIMLPKDMITEGKEFTLENYSGEDAAASALDFALDSESFTFAEDGTLSLGATVQKLNQANFNRDIAARAYVVVNYGGEDVYLYADMNEENVKSIYTLASAALSSDSLTDAQKQIAQGYVDYVNNASGENN